MKVGFERGRNGNLALCLIAESDADSVALNEWLARHRGMEAFPQEGGPQSGQPAIVRGPTGVYAQMHMKATPDTPTLGVDRLWLEPMPVPVQPQPRPAPQPQRRPEPPVVVTDAPPG